MSAAPRINITDQFCPAADLNNSHIPYSENARKFSSLLDNLAKSPLIKTERLNHFAAVNLIGTPAQEILYVRRSSHISHHGQWGSLGGNMDAGETLLTTAIREGLEEGEHWPQTRLEPTFFTTIYHEKRERVGILIFISIVPKSFKPTLNKEHDDFAWCTLDKYPGKVLPSLDRTIKSIRPLLIQRMLDPKSLEHHDYGNPQDYDPNSELIISS